MKVSRRSWHYRLHVFGFTVFNLMDYGPFAYARGRRYEHQPNSLCGYFWSTLALLWLTPILAICTLIVVIAAAIVGATSVVADKTHNVYRTIRPKAEVEPNPEPQPPGLILSYMKARKQKVCPIIELTD
jgi:hypothetical protein